MAIQLPPAVYAGKILRVEGHGSVLMRVDLRFGVSVEKVIDLDGLQALELTDREKPMWHHCMCILLGAKNALLQTAENRRSYGISGTLFLVDVIGQSPIPMRTPLGMNRAYINASEYLLWLRTHAMLDVMQVKSLLDGRPIEPALGRAVVAH